MNSPRCPLHWAPRVTLRITEWAPRWWAGCKPTRCRRLSPTMLPLVPVVRHGDGIRRLTFWPCCRVTPDAVTYNPDTGAASYYWHASSCHLRHWHLYSLSRRPPQPNHHVVVLNGEQPQLVNKETVLGDVTSLDVHIDALIPYDCLLSPRLVKVHICGPRGAQTWRPPAAAALHGGGTRNAQNTSTPRTLQLTEKLGQTGVSSVQAATFHWQMKAAVAGLIGRVSQVARRKAALKQPAPDHSSCYTDLSLLGEGWVTMVSVCSWRAPS